MNRWSGRVALVTGASSGIGKTIAERLAREGMIVWGCGRNITPITDLAKELQDVAGSLHAFKCNVRKEEEILSMFVEIKKQHGGVDVLVNNAGVWHNQSLLLGETELWRDQLEVNVLALAICTREAVKSMQERNVEDGHIIHMSSIGQKSISVAPGFTLYCATKHAVGALLEGHRLELSKLKSNIKVSSILPAIIKTDIFRRGGGQEVHDAIPNRVCIETEDIADSVIYILGCPPSVQIHELVIQHTKHSDIGQA